MRAGSASTRAAARPCWRISSRRAAEAVARGRFPVVPDEKVPMSHLLLSENFPPRTGGSGRWFWETYRRLPRPGYVIAAGQDPRAAAFDRTHDLRVRRLPLT